MKRITAFAAATILLTGALGVGSTATAAGSAPSAAAWMTCVHGKFCIYSGWDGGGSSCQWVPDQPNTASGCPFIQRGAVVKSVANETGKTIKFYKNTNYKNKIGSSKAGTRGNLEGNYSIRSFKD
ncbi:peptidase inhibitor family I36 protein [Streptomyces paludis]|uniref:Peptidase inhibitor n=1 Tax=Streptomyces paludis TaxID=2282738 RepID=A0A345HZ95_9ACTN|nr:peptidase inhibitor family I36 protein [Streptomyces paludis]AXG82019.1 peptidase inhibitor [Streptomyces paludis]